jgi:deoxyribodipyrimidine photo-lyase
MQKFNKNLFRTDYASIVDKINMIHPEQYAKSRNFLNGQVTYLSPYISRGVISVKQVRDSVLKNGFSSFQSEKLIQELAWREYFQRVWQVKKDLIWNDLKQAQSDVQHHKMPNAFLDASTGIQVIDEQIQHLYEVGYAHNHIRMYLAAIACNVGKAHWVQPAKWMYYYLLDGDIASNNCSWQWVAGAFSSQKYYCNQENINKYTNSSQLGTFMDTSYEEIVEMQVPSKLLATSNLQLTTKLPIPELPKIDVTKPTLIYNSYNLDPNWRNNENVNRVLLLEPSHFENYPVSDKVLNFIIALSKNIQDIQIVVGEMDTIQALYHDKGIEISEAIISKEHPLFEHYPGIKDQREWLFPGVTGYYSSFSSFWKKCQRA